MGQEQAPGVDEDPRETKPGSDPGSTGSGSGQHRQLPTSTPVAGNGQESLAPSTTRFQPSAQPALQCGRDRTDPSHCSKQCYAAGARQTCNMHLSTLVRNMRRDRDRTTAPDAPPPAASTRSGHKHSRSDLRTHTQTRCGAGHPQQPQTRSRVEEQGYCPPARGWYNHGRN